MLSINPYLNFDGRSEEALNFYHEVFGGDEPSIMRFSDAPDNPPGGPVDPSMVMHGSVQVGGSTLMVSDSPAEGGITVGNAHHISVQTDSKDEGQRIFDALSDGGRVTMPYADQFWGDSFGMVIDKFGISWMVNAGVNEMGGSG